MLEIRKNLQPLLKEERKKGNLAYLKYDKLVVKPPTESNREKRKRGETESPEAPTTNTKKKQLTEKDGSSDDSTSKNGKPSILNYVARGRTASLSDSKTTKN